MQAEVSHYVYILQCADGTFYTGYSTDPQRRAREHNDGNGAKYTRGRTPVNLVHTEEFNTQSEALEREYEIKQMDRQEKATVMKRSSLQ